MSAALLRRVGKVEAATYDADGERRGGVMVVPPILSIDAWEAIAVPMQAALAEACREDLPIERNHQHEDDRSRAARVATSLRAGSGPTTR